MQKLLKKYGAERLSQAWSRLNRGQWDELLGAQPREFGTSEKAKLNYVIPLMLEIERLVGHKMISKHWWIYDLARTEEQWREWYAGERKKRLMRMARFLAGVLGVLVAGILIAGVVAAVFWR